MAAVLSVCRSPLTSIVNCPNNPAKRNVGQSYKPKNIQSVATAPADVLSLKSTRLRFSQFEDDLPFPKYICRCSTLQSNSNSFESSSSKATPVRYGTKRAFISVSNKCELAFLGSGLHKLGFTIVSTGGTANCLENNGVPLIRVEQLTSFPELFNGPVKIKHSSSSMDAATLAKRDSEHHMESLRNFNFGNFDVVVVNFNPYYEKISLPGYEEEEEGPELIHTVGSYSLLVLAKNYEKALVVVDPQDYRSLLEYLKGEQDYHQFRDELAKKVIQHEGMCFDAKHIDMIMKTISKIKVSDFVM